MIADNNEIKQINSHYKNVSFIQFIRMPSGGKYKNNESCEKGYQNYSENFWFILRTGTRAYKN